MMAVKASDIIAVAKREVGTKATPIRNCKYNTWYYGHAVSGDCYHWCAVFVSWVFNQAAALSSLLYGKNASCGYMAKAFQDHGKLLVPKSSKDVKAGDVVFFHWSNERSTLVPGTYVSDHVGIVTAVNSDGTIGTIEGNTIDTANGQVAARTRSMSVVSCLGRPSYSGTSTGGTTKVTTPSVLYRVRSGGVWRKEVHDLSSFAGVEGTVITDIAIKVTSGTVEYRVHVKGGGWLPYVTGYNTADAKNGYAGNGKPIDAIEIYYTTPASLKNSLGYCLRAKYRVWNTGATKYLDYQYDDEKTGGQDGYAGIFGKTIERVQITLSK